MSRAYRIASPGMVSLLWTIKNLLDRAATHFHPLLLQDGTLTYCHKSLFRQSLVVLYQNIQLLFPLLQFLIDQLTHYIQFQVNPNLIKRGALLGISLAILLFSVAFFITDVTFSEFNTGFKISLTLRLD